MVHPPRWLSYFDEIESPNADVATVISHVRIVQAKYEHAVAAAQKSLAKQQEVSDDEEDDKHEDESEPQKKKASHESSADRAQAAADHIQSVLKAQKKLQQLQESIRSKREESGQRRCVCAFVTFKTEEARLKCMQANPSSIGKAHEVVVVVVVVVVSVWDILLYGLICL